MEREVVSVAEGAVHTLLGKLGKILMQEAQLLGGIRSELQYLKDELESMTAFLQDLTERNEQRKQVKIWMKQVREIAYDVEDCIDEFKYHLGDSDDNHSGGGPVAFFCRATHILLTTRVRHRIAKQIQELKKRTKDISDRNSRYNGNHHIFGAAGSSTAAYDTPANHLDLDLHIDARRRQLVGIEPRQENIVLWLMEETLLQLRVISIFGFGGLGKTTLAMTIYQSLSAEGERFQCQAFVTVSQRFDVKVLMRGILQQIIQPVYKKGPHAKTEAGETSREDLLKVMEAWDIMKLANMLRQHLENRRYLIVLDDIWSISAWEAIRFSLPDSNNGSRILVTTRNRAVARTCCFHEYDQAYEIEALTDDESRDLFFKRIFGSTVNCPDNLREISEKILRKCGGTPLAIVSIAGLLASKPVQSKEQWQKVYSSLGSELETSPSLERLKKILELSYNELPYHLKTCFLYLSVYPEDHIIRRKSVLRRWVAERFVTDRRGLGVFEVAESYFDEFINRSIIHPVDMSFTGKVKTFRVHDMMLEIIVSKSVEENFITLVGEQHTLVPQEKIRRLTVHSGVMKDIATSKMLSHVRSLSIFSYGEILRFGWMKLMRILDLEGCGILRDRDLKNVCRLFQLEYLSVRRTHVIELPTQIGNLKKLETLDIRQTGIKLLPSSITSLPHLTNLLGGSRFYNHSGLWPISEFWGLHVPNKLGNLNTLETLAQVEITEYTSHSVIELGKLSRLRKLGVMMFVDDDSSWTSLVSALKNLSSSLCSLLLWRPDGAMNFDSLDSLSRPPMFMRSINFRGQLRKLPKWFPFLSNLTELTLRATELSAKEDLEVLARLPSLLYLRLHHSAYVESEFSVTALEFPVLKLLVIHISMIEAWKARFHEGALPRLEKLELSLFEEAFIQEISGIEFLPNLKEVSISVCPGDAMKDLIQSLMVDAEKNLNKPTVTSKIKKWVSHKSRTDPPLDYRGNLWS
ncbi:hypothetical protein BS78_02G339900 [Paspalum vaginatum]|nr:hypothetical protein BS78_02G339900 [Paspalum vaginatum]